MKSIEDLRRADEHTRSRLQLSLAVTRELKIYPEVRAVYLVGGVAKGTATKFSDTDVVVEVASENDILPVTRLAGNIADKHSPFRIHPYQEAADRANLFDVNVVTSDRFKHPRNYRQAVFIISLKKDAIPLYQAPSHSFFAKMLVKMLPPR